MALKDIYDSLERTFSNAAQSVQLSLPLPFLQVSRQWFIDFFNNSISFSVSERVSIHKPPFKIKSIYIIYGFVKNGSNI